MGHGYMTVFLGILLSEIPSLTMLCNQETRGVEGISIAVIY